MNLPDFDNNEYREVDNDEIETNEIATIKNEVGPYIGYTKVDDVKDDDELAEEAKDKLMKIACGVLAGLIIICSSALLYHYINNNKEKKVSKEAIEDYQERQNEEINKIIAEMEKRKEEKKRTNINIDNDATNKESIAEENSVIEENNVENDYDINYSGAEEFYQHIVSIRDNHSDFAESFQSVDDVKNLVDFIYMFNPLYKNMNITSSIRSQEEFAGIIGEYYRSCVKYGIDAELYLIFDKDSLAYEVVEESESLANDLKNGKGDDYTIANRYYRFMGENLVDGRTWIDRKTKNAPLIDLLRDQFEEYRYVGNMLEARTYQKNDSLAMPKIEIAHPYQDEVETEVFYDYLTCPDWGIDNVVSKSEEKTETDLVHLEDGHALFQMVDESFKEVLGRSR